MACSAEILDDAAADIASILQYLRYDSGSPGAALRFIDELERRIDALGSLPESCPTCADALLAARGYRTFSVSSYIVLYRIDDGAIYIAHVFHHSQGYAMQVLQREPNQ